VIGCRRKEVIGGATLYLGDSLSVLPSLEGPASVVTDPPYCSGGYTDAAKAAAKSMGVGSGTLKRMGWFDGDNMTTAGICFLLRAVAGLCVPRLAGGGTFTAFTDWRMIPVLAPVLETAGLRYRNLLVWRKPYSGMGVGFRPQHELGLHMSYGTPKYHAKDVGNVIDDKRVPGAAREHPTQKPVPLLTEIVRTVAPVGGVVIDPFMGSGSTGVAALETGRRVVGVEVDPVHFDTACRRVEAVIRASDPACEEPIGAGGT
jgi:site-specific DNA-methyltransferase (adenine-specific)